MQVEATLIPREGILVPNGYKGAWVPVLVPLCGEDQMLLPLLVTEFQFLVYPDHNLITTPTELTSLLELEIGSSL